MDLKQSMSENLYRKAWDTIEDEKTQPRFLREIISTPYKEFSEKVLQQDPRFVKKIVQSLYSGDVYILKQGFSGKFLRDLSGILHQHGKQTSSSFHKMLDGCPDFHRVITPELAKNYSLRQIKHSYYFFPWNNDPFNLLESVNKRWRIFKFLGGFPLDAYENNLPSTGVVDRLQIAQYPSGVGELELHSDPYLNQKIAISGIMSKRGMDYKTGGAYILNSNKEKIDVEDDMDIGDIYLVYPTVFHGVETIDRGSEVDWSSFSGRWFMGLYSNASDCYAKRHTCYGVEDQVLSGG
ncbi:MAG: hypothetical protein HOB18_13925 [Nitrospina sp.]|nr:hypothetical protein [Nitrospina sp.]